MTPRTCVLNVQQRFAVKLLADAMDPYRCYHDYNQSPVQVNFVCTFRVSPELKANRNLAHDLHPQDQVR